MSNGNDPAYPCDIGPYMRNGLTKREAFAMAAMQGFIACRNNWDAEQIAAASIEQADALLAELSKESPK
jgi:hypothetical protein